MTKGTPLTRREYAAGADSHFEGLRSRDVLLPKGETTRKIEGLRAVRPAPIEALAHAKPLQDRGSSRRAHGPPRCAGDRDRCPGSAECLEWGSGLGDDALDRAPRGCRCRRRSGCRDRPTHPRELRDDTAPAGWTLVRKNSNTGGASLTQVVYFRVAGPSEPASYSWTLPFSTAAAGAILAYSGLDTASPILAHSGIYSPNVSLIPAPSVTTTVGGALVVGFFGNNGIRSPSPPNGMTERSRSRSGRPRCVGRSCRHGPAGCGPNG